ncbi:MAG: hypothetical protein AAGA32_16350, partial [Pseudomonadota bacterium]
MKAVRTYSLPLAIVAVVAASVIMGVHTALGRVGETALRQDAQLEAQAWVRQMASRFAALAAASDPTQSLSDEIMERAPVGTIGLRVVSSDGRLLLSTGETGAGQPSISTVDVTLSAAGGPRIATVAVPVAAPSGGLVGVVELTR